MNAEIFKLQDRIEQLESQQKELLELFIEYAGGKRSRPVYAWEEELLDKLQAKKEERNAAREERYRQNREREAMRVHFRLREHVTVTIEGLPGDLTRAEAERLSQMILAQPLEKRQWA